VSWILKSQSKNLPGLSENREGEEALLLRVGIRSPATHTTSRLWEDGQVAGLLQSLAAGRSPLPSAPAFAGLLQPFSLRCAATSQSAVTSEFRTSLHGSECGLFEGNWIITVPQPKTCTRPGFQNRPSSLCCGKSSTRTLRTGVPGILKHQQT
jgi:hypothetical protein